VTTEEIKKTIIGQLCDIAPEYEGEAIPEDENLQRALEIDSFDLLNLLTALKDILGVEVPEADYARVDTLEHMAGYFADRMS